MMLNTLPCTFELNYNVEGIGLNDEDYEFDPKIELWTSWGKNNRAIEDNLLYTDSIIKKVLKKGEKYEKKAKESKYGKKVMKRYKKEKQGIKEFKQERKERKKKEKEAKSKPTTNFNLDWNSEHKKKKNKKNKKTKQLGNDYDSSSGSTSSGSVSDNDDGTESSEEPSEDETSSEEEQQPYQEYSSESEDEYLMSNLKSKNGGLGNEKQVKCYKESKTQGPFNWPGVEEGSILRGDENLWLKLYIHTRHSGQKSIDKREAPFVIREQQAGITKIPINPLLIEISKWMNGITIDKSLEIKRISDNKIKVFFKSSFFEPKLARIQYAQLTKKGITDQSALEKKIINTCTKANIIIEMTISNLTIPFVDNCIKKLTNIHDQYTNINYDQFVSLMKASLPIKNNINLSSNIDQQQQQQQQSIYIPFGSSLHENILEKSMEPLINNYMTSMLNLASTPSKKKGSLYKPSNKQVENLHLAYYSTEQGDEPVMGYLLRNRKEFDYNSEKYFLIQLNASLKRNGLTPEYFIKIVNEQFKRNDSVIIHNYMKCVESVYNLASFAASQVLYTSDFRYPNDQYVKRGKQVQMDSWDMDISQGTSNCDDCEGMGSLDLEILDCIQDGRNIKGDGDSSIKRGWESPILETARQILLNRSHSGVAGTVNDAFIDANGQKVSNKKIKELPVIGEEIDINSTVGGHFHGLAIPNAILSKWLKNSVDLSKEVITIELKEFISKEYKPWQYEENILVLEGTGNIDPFVLPLETTFKNDKIEFNKRKYQKDLTEFIKISSPLKDDDEDENNNDTDKEGILSEQLLIKQNLESHNPKELFILNHMISTEAQPFYIKNKKQHVRISKFYKDIVHILSKTLFSKDKSFSQGVFCYKDKKTFGVDIGDLLRDLGNKESNIMIIRPLIPMNQEHWNILINPLIDTIKRQQPISIIGNFTKEEESKLVSQRLFQQGTTEGGEKIMVPSKHIKVTSENGYYIINGEIKNPSLNLKQGVSYKIEVNAKGHPFWILTDNDEKYKKHIQNNGTENGTIKIYIPCNSNPPSFLRYQCGNHNYMHGDISIELNDKKCLSLSTNEDSKRSPPIDYKYEKPKWHFEEVAQNDNQTIMKFFFRKFNIDKHPGFLKCLKDEIGFLMKNKGVVDYAFYEQRFIPQCEGLIELLLLCNCK